MTNDTLLQDPVETTSASRSEFESDILNQVRSEVQKGILHTARESWSQERHDAVEESVLAETRMILDALSATELQSASALQIHIGRAIAETRRLVHLGGLRRGV